MANQLQCGYESYASLVWANYLGDQNVYTDNFTLNTTTNPSSSLITGDTIGGVTGTTGQDASQPNSQYPHVFGGAAQEQKIREKIWNRTETGWKFYGPLDYYRGQYFRNKAVSWQTFEVNSRATILLGNIGLVGKYGSPQSLLLQLDASRYGSDPLCWHVVSARGSGGSYMDRFNADVHPDGRNVGGIDVGEYPGYSPIDSYFALGVAKGDKFLKPQPIARALAGPKGKFRRIDIIQSWGYASSSPFNMFDKSGEGGPCFNRMPGCHIVLLDGVEIGRLPIFGGMNVPQHRPLLVHMNPLELREIFGPGLPDFYPSGTANNGIKNMSAWALNYDCNWYEGDNTNKQGPKWTTSCYDQKVFSPTGLVDGCYDFECNSALNFTSLDPAIDRQSDAKFAPYAKLGEKPDKSDVVTWGTFPVYGMQIMNVGFSWAESPAARLWLTIGYGIFSVVDPEDFTPTVWLKLFLYTEQEELDLNNKGWAFSSSQICDAERSYNRFNGQQVTSFTAVEVEAISRIWASGNEIRITANF